MLKSFLLISLRNIINGKGASYLNILGLMIGIATGLFIFHYLNFETSYDRFSDEREVFRIETHYSNKDVMNYRSAYSVLNTGPYLESSFPEIEQYTRLAPFSEEGTALLRYNPINGHPKKVHIEKVYHAEQSIFEVFPISLIQGDQATAMMEPNSILLSATTAKNIFDKDWESGASVIGRQFEIAETGISNSRFVVTGVFEDRPSNTHLMFDALVAKAFPRGELSSGEVTQVANVYTYLLKSKASVLSEAWMEGIDAPNTTLNEQYFLRPIEGVHLSSGISNNPEPGTNSDLLYFLALLGLIIMLLASSNYLNNTIFNSIDRAKEIGIRKLLGIKPYHLSATFLGEALFINVIAGLLAMLLFLFGMKLLGLYSAVEYPAIGEINFMIYVQLLIALVVVSTLVSGIYPAFYFNQIDPIGLLKGKLQIINSKLFSGASKTIRALLIFQLVIATVFLSSVYIVYVQLRHMEENDKQPLNFNITGIMPGVSGANDLFTLQAVSTIEELTQGGSVSNATFTNLYKGEIKTAATINWLPISNSDSVGGELHLLAVDPNFWGESNEPFLAGHNFSNDFGNDHGNVIINSATAKMLGYDHPDSVIHEVLSTDAGDFTILGVVKDQNATPHPTIYVTGFRYRTYIDLDLHYPGQAGESLEQFLHKTQVHLSTPLPYISLLRRDYESQRIVEQNVLKMFLFFALLAVAIASMGMFGLSTFITQKRMKEIGLRKVLGATSISTMALLLYDFLKLVAIGTILSVPVIFYGGKVWLENYAHRITIGPVMLILPVVMITLIFFMVIVKKCWIVVANNPIQSLEIGR